jgi:hypothetical protein
MIDFWTVIPGSAIGNLVFGLLWFQVSAARPAQSKRHGASVTLRIGGCTVNLAERVRLRCPPQCFRADTRIDPWRLN